MNALDKVCKRMKANDKLILVLRVLKSVYMRTGKKFMGNLIVGSLYRAFKTVLP